MSPLRSLLNWLFPSGVQAPAGALADPAPLDWPVPEAVPADKAKPADVAAAALALSRPLLDPKDHYRHWGLLHGVALASRRDPGLRRAVQQAVRSLGDGAPSARRALACAVLAEAAGDTEAVGRFAAAAQELADHDGEAAAEAEYILACLRGLESRVARLSGPWNAMDTRRAVLNMEGWSLDERDAKPLVSRWRDGEGDVVVLEAGEPAAARDMFDVAALRERCRRQAERRGAGLIEAGVVHGALGPTVQMIDKVRAGTGFTHGGTLITPLPGASLTWTVTAGERGTTGLREAAVASALINHGLMTMDSYQEVWAADPYEPAYHGVERAVLRYVSDDARYDPQFPAHPLSKVRRTLRELLRRPDLAPLAAP